MNSDSYSGYFRNAGFCSTQTSYLLFICDINKQLLADNADITNRSRHTCSFNPCKYNQSFSKAANDSLETRVRIRSGASILRCLHANEPTLSFWRRRHFFLLLVTNRTAKLIRFFAVSSASCNLLLLIVSPHVWSFWKKKSFVSNKSKSATTQQQTNRDKGSVKASVYWNSCEII